jgi:hypothetical protein
VGVVTAGVLLLTVAGLLIAGGVVGAVGAARGVQFLPHSTSEASPLTAEDSVG